jgi:hypothetical protein
MQAFGIKRFAVCVAAAALIPVATMNEAAAQMAVRAGGDTANGAVAAKALKIVGGIHGSWSQMPSHIATPLMTPGALIGNGSVGVAIGGSADRQEFYIGREDFWSVLRGRIMPVGRLELTAPALQGATARLRENIGPADVTADFVQGGNALQWRAWAADGRNMFAVELKNPGKEALQVRAALLDGFGRKDLGTLSGSSDGVRWLRVSPETVRATIGGTRRESAAAPNVSIRSVKVFAIDAARGTTGRPLYAWRSKTALAGGDGHGVYSCGDIIMPMRSFSVRASVDVNGADGAGVIFSAMAGHRWMKQRVDPTDPLGNLRGHDLPRQQGAAAGLEIYVSHGKLAANLNGTVVMAKQVLPLREWVHLTVAYDGEQLVLLANGKQIGETSDFPVASEVMGPKWDWAATHPGDKQIPYGGIGPEGVLAMRVIGAHVSTQAGETHFDVPAGGRVMVLVAAMDNRDTPAYFRTAIAALRQATMESVAASWSRHLVWWRKFWSKSYVEIPDKTVQSWWYGSLYVLASCSRTGNVAPGLWGNWITSTHMAWQGDYTLDYNYQAPFWAAYPTNHVSLANPYDAPLLAWLKRGRGLAEKLHEQGLLYYTHLAPSPGWSADNFRALDQKSDALFAATNCIQRWRYTRDAAYARKVWPFLTGVASYWDHELKLLHGRYVDYNDAADEHLWGPVQNENPATTIGFLKMLYPALVDMSKQLHQGETMRATWQEIGSHLSNFPLAPADSVAAIRQAVVKPIPPDQMVILQSEHGMQWVNINDGDRFSANPPVRPMGSSAGMISLQTVFPAWSIGLESSAALREAAVNTVKYSQLWYDNNDTSSYYPAAADVGYSPESILKHLHLLVTHIGYPNFAYAMPAGGVENEATVPTTIAAMLLQSYQKEIHVFADWPKDEDASFGNLLAVGDFLVSSKMAGGRVAYVRVASQRGGLCTLANPWGANRTVQLRVAEEKPVMLHGAVLQVATRPGERLVFTPIAR